jgi:hypothetical protein
MIVFGTAVTRPEVFERNARRGIDLVAEPDTRVLTRREPDSIFRNYNALMDEAAEIKELEALVLLHQDAEIQDPDFMAKLRTALSEPEVGVVGCVGSIGVRTIAWWEGSVTWASFVHRYTELGGGDLPSLTWDERHAPPYAQLGEVDTVDGFVLVLSPWVVHNIRFDEQLGQRLHGYDFDFCLQVRETGRKICTADFKVVHNHSLELASDLEHWTEAYIAVCEKWDGRMPGIGTGGGSWKQRARRGEAEAAVTRAVAFSTEMKIAARSAEQERELRVMTDSLGWRLTRPLRLLTRGRRAYARRRAR